MVTIERQLGGLLRYRKIYFPRGEAALHICHSMMANDVVRMFAVSTELRDLPHLIKRRTMLTSTIDLSAGPERVFAAMKKKSCRYEVHRAEKMIDKIEIERNSLRGMRDFLPLYNSFARSKGPVPRLSALRFREYAPHSDVFVLYQQQRPLCCHLLLRDEEARTARLLYSGSRRFESPEEAAACGALNRYLHWHEMKHYHAQGILNYDFGGIRNLTHPTARFKLSFGGAVVTEHYYLLGGLPWLTRLGNLFYERFFKSAAPTRHVGLQPSKE